MWGIKLTLGDAVPLLLCEGGWLELERAIQLEMYPTREAAQRRAVELALLRSQNPGTVGDVGLVQYVVRGEHVHTR